MPGYAPPSRHQIYKKIEKELQDKKREMANVIELSNISYEARDQAQNEIAALRAQADREQAAYEQEIKEASGGPDRSPSAPLPPALFSCGALSLQLF